MRRGRRTWIAIGGLGVACAAGAGDGSAPPGRDAAVADRDAMPGPARGPRPAGRLALNAGCVECHAGHAADWRESLHARAWTDPDFFAGYVREPDGFCRGCHAPEADPGRQRPGAAGEIGVACVTCHVPVERGLPPGATLAGRGRRPMASKSSLPPPHAIVRDPRFDTAAACGACHEFTSPDEPQVAMQSTITEYEGSVSASAGCAACHMPETDGGGLRRRDHRFAASRDVDLLRDAVTVSVERPREDTLQVTLVPGELGHAFPTGDMFRRIVVDAQVLDDELPIAGDRRELTRTFAMVGDGISRHREQVSDTRVRPGVDPVVLTLDLHGAGSRPAHWRVIYERADLRFDDEQDPVFGRVIIYEGWQGVAR